jgi:hypothetical protein
MTEMMTELGDKKHAIIQSYATLQKKHKHTRWLCTRKPNKNHAQEIVVHKEFQECHEAKVVVHTLLINVVDEVYVQVPCTTKETSRPPNANQTRQGEGSCPTPTGTECRASGKTEEHPTIKARGVTTEVVSTENMLHQGQACVEEFSRVMDYNFQLWTHLQNTPKSMQLKIAYVQVRHKSTRKSRCCPPFNL